MSPLEGFLNRIAAATGVQRAKTTDAERVQRNGDRANGDASVATELRKLAERLERRVK